MSEPQTIRIDDIEYVRADSINIPAPEAIIAVGSKVLIRTVTHYHTGRIVAVDERWITLNDAAWIASTGRFGAALKTGVLGEIEPFPGLVAVAVGAVVDVTRWEHDLPKVVK